MDLLDLDSSQLDIISEYQLQLVKLGVNLDDEALLTTINGYTHNLEGAIQALIESSAKGQLENPNRYLIRALQKGWKARQWVNFSYLPVRTAADFDTGHTLEERIANYQRLADITQSICQKRPVKSTYRGVGLFSKKPDAATVERFMAEPILRKELEKAIALHPEWGYEITPTGIQEIEF
ncbi:MAG: hypothetical protein NVS2B14_08980 [Chamaesiphon sp.]